MTHSLPRLLSDAAAAQADVVAAEIVDGPTLTYRAWHERSDTQACGLSAEGIGAGDRVALLFDTERWTEYAVAYMAVVKVRAIAVPLSAELSSLEIARALRASGAKAVIAPGGLGPADLHPPRIDPEQLEHARADHLLEPDGAGEITEILVRSRPLTAPLLQPRSAEQIVAGAAPLLVAAGSHGALLHWWPVGSRPGQDALCAALQPRGVRCVVLPAYAPIAIQQALAAGNITACSMHPAVADALLHHTPCTQWPRSLRAVILASGRVARALQQRLAGLRPDARVLIAEAADDPDDAGRLADAAPAAASQDGMVWHECFAPGCQNLPGLARRFRGAIDVAALGRSLTEIVRRHEPLRSTFAVDGRSLRQIVHPPRRVGLKRSDLSTLPPEQREQEVERLVAEAGTAPFDLVEGPLFEPSLVRLAADDHVLIIRTHHSVFDDWSVGVFRRQLAALYEAFAARREPAPWEPSVSFSAYAREQRRRLAGDAGAAEMRYWAGVLRDAPLTTQLPVRDHTAPAGATQPTGGPITITFPAEVRAALRHLARRAQATVYMVLLAAFGAVVSRHTGQEDLLVSTVVANRNRTELEPLIGCFTKKVPLRLDLRGDPEFTHMVARARAALLGALQHQDLPFEAVVQTVLGSRAAVHGLVPTIVVMVQGVTPRQELVMPGVESAGFETSARAPRAHFMSAPPQRAPRAPWGEGLYIGTFVILSVTDGENELSCTARGAFDGAAVEALLDDVVRVAAAASAEPWRRLSDLTSAIAPPAPVARDGVDVDGFRVDVDAIATALRTCPGVRRAEVHLSVRRDGAPRLEAEIMADGVAPSLDSLRACLWARMPGYAWPAAIRISGAPQAPEPAPTPPDTALLGGMWAEVLGIDRCLPDENYWQDFSFLEALARIRDAGVRVPAPLITRNRTLRTLAAALTAHRAGAAFSAAGARE